MTTRNGHLCVLVALCMAICGICGAAEAEPLFNPQVPHSVGDGPSSVAIGDLDANGDLDLAVANELSDDVTILLGTGGGAFLFSANYTAGVEPSSVALGLLDADTTLDMAVANRDSGDVSVFLGAGDGTFGTASVYGAGSSPGSIAVGDLNGDGDLDLAVSNANSDDVSILLGNGDGTFQTAADYPAGSSPMEVAIGLLNGDANPDLAVVNQFSSDVSVLLGNGDGSFQAPDNYAVGTLQFPSAVAIGYLDADADADLVAAREGAGDVAVLLGNGDGTFQTPDYYDAGLTPVGVAVGDLDLDADEDIAVADFANSGLVWVLLGNGDGSFQTATSFAAQSKASSVALGDLDKAGTPDLAVTNYGSDTMSVFLNTKETCKDADGDGYGQPAHPSCGFPEEDCDDSNPDIHPGAEELCNDVDDDCDINTADGADEEWVGALCDGPDSDLCLEGSYSCESALQVCSDETDDDVEICDGVDNDCDGMIPTWETDDDGDHYVECILWEGDDPDIYGGGDCKDTNPDRSPGLEENHDVGNCEDGLDNDCDDLADIEDPGCPAIGPCADIPPGG